jgi:DNA-directed RNA polymerase specialized sigma24 family protein
MQEPEDPREGLEAVVALRRLLEMVEAAQVEDAYVAGWSWARIAAVLGVSRQAVHKKHAKRLRAKFAGEGLGEGGAGR